MSTSSTTSMASTSSTTTMQRLYESVGFRYLDDYQTFHRHQKGNEERNLPVTVPISARDLPPILFRQGVVLPEKTEGVLPAPFTVPVLTDFSLLKASSCNPSDFLYDVDVFTTLSAIRSLVCQWVDKNSYKSKFFRTQPHYCQMDRKNRLFLNTGTNYTVPFEMSTTLLNRFALLDHEQTWEDFIDTSYSGVAKFSLNNGCRVGFTYKMYAQHDGQPVDLIVKSGSRFMKEVDFHFLNCFLTKKKLWRYECHRNRTVFQEELGSRDIWDRISVEKQYAIIDAFENRLPNYLRDLGNNVVSEDVVNLISPVNQEFRLRPKRYFQSLY